MQPVNKEMFKTLHQAIIYVLENQPNAIASFETISDEIKKNNLWKRPSDKKYPPPYQIRLRTVVARKYKHLFKLIGEDKIQLGS